MNKREESVNIDELPEYFPEFKNLNEIHEFLRKDHKIRSRFKMILLIGGASNQDEILSEYKSNYHISETEDFYQIKKIDEKDRSITFLGYLWFLPDKSSSILFTFSSMRNVKRYFFRPFIYKNSKINLLWITHRLTFELMEFLAKENNIFINLIDGIYSPSSYQRASLRPDFDRKIKYEGKDAFYSFYELKDLYGINIENFGGIFFNNNFQFHRKEAMITFKISDLKYFINISKWIFKKAKKYMSEISKFRKELYRTIFLKREYQLSNCLLMEFCHKLSEEVLSEMIKMIEFSNEIEILSKYNVDTDDFTLYNIELYNRHKTGIFKITINPNFVRISQIVETNFISIFPILDILDYTEPINEISILKS